MSYVMLCYTCTFCARTMYSLFSSIPYVEGYLWYLLHRKILRYFWKISCNSIDQFILFPLNLKETNFSFKRIERKSAFNFLQNRTRSYSKFLKNHHRNRDNAHAPNWNFLFWALFFLLETRLRSFSKISWACTLPLLFVLCSPLLQNCLVFNCSFLDNLDLERINSRSRNGAIQTYRGWWTGHSKGMLHFKCVFRNSFSKPLSH